MDGVEMHMVSGGRVVDWSGIKDLAKGAMVQVMVNVHGGIGKRGKEEETGQPLGIGWSIWGKEFGGGTFRDPG